MSLNLLQRSLIEKAGYENGFENNSPTEDSEVCLSSARHAAIVNISRQSDGQQLLVKVKSHVTGSLVAELSRSFADIRFGINTFLLPNITQLAAFLRRASTLAQALPNQAVIQFQKDLDDVMNAVPDGIKNTEVERMVRQRIGQDRFRRAMLDYWGNACAVTGISVTEVLRASHAKPWSECYTDEERLDVFNGFLLCANLDALFDQFLISFDETGTMLVSSLVKSEQKKLLGLDYQLALRWLAPEHMPFLNYHRQSFIRLQEDLL